MRFRNGRFVTLTPLQTRPIARPLPIVLISGFQFTKGAFLLLVALLAASGRAGKLAYIPDLRDLVFVAAHGKEPHGLLLFFFGSYALVIGSGIWRLRRWARNSLVLTSAMMLVFWLAHHDFGTSLPVMPAISEVEQQTVYILLLLDSAIFLYLKFHAVTADCFPPRART